MALCVRNEEEKLKKCLEALTFADEIVIVLDGCTDKSKEIARRFTKKQLNIVNILGFLKLTQTR